MKRLIILKNLIVKGLAAPPPEYLAQNMERWSEEDRRKFITETQGQYADQVRQLHESGLWDDMSESERDFFQAGPTEIREQALIDSIWLAESAVCLLWALGYVSELPPYDKQANPELLNTLPLEPIAVLVKRATLRPPDIIGKQRDLAELWHWRSRGRQLEESGGVPPTLPEGLTVRKLIQMVSSKAAEDGAFPGPLGDDFPAFEKPYRELTPEEFSQVTSIAMERHRALNWLCGYAPSNKWEDTPIDT